MDSSTTFSIPILKNLTPFLKFSCPDPDGLWPWHFPQEHVRPEWWFSMCFVWRGYSFKICRLKMSEWAYLRPMVVIQAQFGSWPLIKVISCHIRSYEFLLITSYRNEIERCRLSHCVQLAESHQLMCILTFLGHHLTISLRGLRSPEVKIWRTFRG